MPSTDSTPEPWPSSTMELTPAQNSALPYTQDLAGVNLPLNDLTSYFMYGSLVLIGLLVIAIRIAEVLHARRKLARALTSLPWQEEELGHVQVYNTLWPNIKKHLLIAPLIRKRHNNEIQLSSAVSLCTIPSRSHAILLTLYILSNAGYCCILDYQNQPRAALFAEARGRTGHLAVMNMLPLFLFAARNNPFIQILGIPFDTFNLFHRWIGRTVIAEAIAHVFLWGVNNYNVFGLHGLWQHLLQDPFLIYGFIGALAMTSILLHSPSPIRHAFYEFFLAIHQLLALAALVAILSHVFAQSLPQKPILITICAIWEIERIIRIVRLFTSRANSVFVEALSDGACRLTFRVSSSWSTQPGRHIYIYIPRIAAWTSHPFSVAWVERLPGRTRLSKQSADSASSIMTDEIVPLPLPKSGDSTTISCIVSCRTGMTAALYRRANASRNKSLTMTAWVEGPYGTGQNLRSYKTAVLFAGGVGITHQLSHVNDLVDGIQSGTAATKKIVLYWSVKKRSHLSWIQGWLDELTSMQLRGGAQLKVVCYASRWDVDEMQNVDIYEATVAAMKERDRGICRGRMPVASLVETEYGERIGDMMVSVCGPGGLADDVRAATRGLMGNGGVDFEEESFTW